MDIRLDNADTLNMKVDYLASRYAVLSDRIEKDFSGDEKAEQLDKLNQVFKNETELLVASFSKSVGAFYDELGGLGTSKEMCESLLIGIANRIEEYQNHISQSGDYSGVSDDTEKWLLQNDAYMAARLRESMNPGLSALNRTNAEYSLNDLGIAAVAAKYMSHKLDNAPILGNDMF